jgi:hypothetical protein
MRTVPDEQHVFPRLPQHHCCDDVTGNVLVWSVRGE